MISKKLLYVTLFSLSWSSTIFFQKLALNAGSDPMILTVQVAFISAILLTIYILATRRGELRALNASVLKSLIPIGVLIGLGYITEKFGLALSTAINFSFLIKSTLVYVILLAYIFLKEPINRKKIMLMITFMSGAYLISTGGTTLIPHFGDLLLLSASFFYAAALIINKRLVDRLSPEVISWGRVFFALIPLLVVTLFLGAQVLVVVTPLYVVLAGISLSLLAIYISKTISVSSASYLTMMSMMVPVITSVLGVSLLGESMNIFQMFGGILVITSGLLVHKWNI